MPKIEFFEKHRYRYIEVGTGKFLDLRLDSLRGFKEGKRNCVVDIP